MSSEAVILTVTIYVAILFAVAWRSGRHAGNAGFFTGERRTPWYMAAFAMIGAAMSGVTYISVPGSVATDAFSYMQMVLGFTVGQLVIAYGLVPLFYRWRVVSLYEYLDSRFGITSHRTGAWFFFVSKILAAALKVYVVCAVLQLLVFDNYGLPLWCNAVITMFFVWLYTQRGGVKSLIWTDSLKTLCLVVSLALSVYYIARALDLGWIQTVETVLASPQSRIFFFDDPASGRYFWKMFFAGIFVLIAMTGLDQDLMQKNLSCATPRDAQKNIVLTAFCQIGVILLFLVLGVLLYRYAAQTGIALPEKSDLVFPTIAVHGGLPRIVGILFVVGVISSTWSAAGSALTALTTSFTYDLMDPSHRRDDRHLTRIRHRVHASIAAVMCVVILCFDLFGNDSVINLVYKVASYTYGPILGLFAFGILTRLSVKDRWVPLVAIVAPILSAILQQMAIEVWNYQIGFELLLYNALFTCIGLLILSQRKHEKVD